MAEVQLGPPQIDDFVIDIHHISNEAVRAPGVPTFR